jgi:hypothetical protein
VADSVNWWKTNERASNVVKLTIYGKAFRGHPLRLICAHKEMLFEEKLRLAERITNGKCSISFTGHTTHYDETVTVDMKI